MPVLLEAVDVIKDYFVRDIQTLALNGLSLQIEPGEFTTLAGPSGCGKTTLLNLLGTLDLPTEGEILVAGGRVSEMSEAERADLRLRKMGFIFQAYNLIPVLTATENVEFVLLLQGISAGGRRERAARVLVDLGLGELLHKRPPEMSGGQQQRVAVARAIAAQPEIILADEPTANLDSKTAASLLDLMYDMNQKSGATFVFSTHDPQVMERAGRILRMVDGQIVKDEKIRS